MLTLEKSEPFPLIIEFILIFFYLSETHSYNFKMILFY